MNRYRTQNAANEITAVANPSGVIQPAYDKVGNQTADNAPGDWDRQFDLTWDAWNRLVRIEDSSTVIQTNAYDGLSRRITSSDGTHTTHYYYDRSWRAFEEYLNAASTPHRRYLWGMRSRWDLVKRQFSASGSLDQTRYVLYDAMDPVAVCDETGNVTQRFEYSPFGETTFMEADFSPDTSPGDWNWLFHGEFRDRDSAYYNYGYRYYNPTTGRWPSRDPIGEEGGVNLYGFVGNHSVNKLDYLGLQDFFDDLDENKVALRCHVIIFVGHNDETENAAHRLKKTKGGEGCGYMGALACATVKGYGGANRALVETGIINEEDLIPNIVDLPDVLTSNGMKPVGNKRGFLVLRYNDNLVKGDTENNGMNPHRPDWVDPNDWRPYEGWEKQLSVFEDYYKKAVAAAGDICKKGTCCKSVRIRFVFLPDSPIDKNDFSDAFSKWKKGWVMKSLRDDPSDGYVRDIKCK